MRVFGLLVITLPVIGCDDDAPEAPPADDTCGIPGTVCTVAGDAEIGLGRDGVPATASSLYFPQDIAYDDDGNLVIVDFNNHRIRRVVDGTVEGVIGLHGIPGDGPEGPASEAAINHPTGVAFHDGSMWIAGFHNARLLRIDLVSEELSFEAGNAQRGYAGDGGSVADAVLNQPTSLVFDDDGSILFSDQGNQLVRRLSPDGAMAHFAGTLGDPTCRGDGGPANEAGFGTIRTGYTAPSTRLLRVDRELFVVDTDHARIRVIDLDDGTIHTAYGPEGCGEPPQVVVPLLGPSDLAVADDGTVTIADAGAHCLYAVSPDGAVDVVAGRCGTSGFEGDGGPAGDALFAGIGGLEIDPDGALVLADTNNHRIRRIAR